MGSVRPVVIVRHSAFDLLDALSRALDGSGPALLPLPFGEPGQALREAAGTDEPLDDDTALLLPTSGSTGSPKVVELSRTALVASADATHDRLAGPGCWLLALPLTHVAGWQVLVRSAVARTVPVALDTSAPFTAETFAAAGGMSTDGPRYTALVPTQLSRLLDDPRGTTALAGFDAVLVGGAATPSALLQRARDAGIAVRTTYGMTETSGGCVYDGSPLDGVRVRLDDDRRVLLAGPVLANGYRNDPELTAVAFAMDPAGTRWFRTHDLGALSTDGHLDLRGRLDDVIITGGTNVSPAAVEHLLLALDGVHEALVVGVPDAEWGQLVVALVVADRTPALADVRSVVTERLGRAAAPRHVVDLPALPLRGIGKPDRVAATRLARQHLADTHDRD
jgi:o-succinylbenzoate---CoA ligase